MEKDSLAYWRVNILFAILFAALVLCTFAIAAPFFLVIKEKVWGLAIFDILGYLICIGLLFSRRITYKIRAAATLVMFYVVGLGVIIYVGPLSGGPIWMFTFAVLVGVLLGAKAAIAAIAINGFTLTIIAWLLITGQFGQSFPFFNSLQAMVAAGVNFIVLNLITALSVSVLVQGLVSSHRKEKVLTESLEGEQARLIETKNRLELEIEDRKLAEKALKESEENYRLLANNITDNIWILDLGTLSFSYVSPSVIGITGYSADEATRFQLKDVLTPSSLELATRILSEELSEEHRTADPTRSRTLELEQYHKDGTTVWTEVSVKFIRYIEGHPSAILGVTRDVSERKRLQDQLHKSQKMESLGLMAGGIAHDLNNILSGIVSYPDLMLMDLPEDSPLRKPLETIKESGNRAADVVSDLITVARGVATRKEVSNLNTMIKDYFSSAEHMKIEAMHPAIIYNSQYDPELLNINCSPSHIKKSLLNLVANASESIKGGGTVIVSTMNRYLDEPMVGYENVRKGEYAVLTISDNGSGISPGDLERIFEPFYTKKIMGRSGTGLGLAVVWNTVQDHKGYINIKSSKEGTIFELYFPVTRDELTAEDDQVPFEHYVGHGEMILVVDDEESQREIACGLLARMGYSAVAVSSGEEAIEYLKEHSVDLIVLDMIMPRGMNGRETYEEVIKIHPNQKAIIASGFAETDDVKAAQKLGVGQYIKKPYTLEKIGRAVKDELKK